MIHGDITNRKERMKSKPSASRFLTNLSDAVKSNKETKEYKKGFKKALDKARK